MSANPVRLQAIKAVEAYVPPAISFDPGEEPGEIFGENVFSLTRDAEAPAEVGLQVGPGDHREVGAARPRWSPTRSPRR